MTVTPTGKDFIYRIAPDGHVSIIVQSPRLNQPNGISLLPSDDLLVSTRGAGEIYELTLAGEKRNVRTLPGKLIDGVGQAPDGRIFASSWETSEVYSVNQDGHILSLFGKLSAPAADFHFDMKRNRILPPLLRTNSLGCVP